MSKTFNKQPWPTQKAMCQIYKENFWGGEKGAFYSGVGSHDAAILDPYLREVKAFLTSFNPLLKVCDLGCGDFNVGKELVKLTKEYIAVDIVPELIERNKRLFSSKQLSFHCLDLATDPLPQADCAILRQVLQHLSNKEIKQIVEKLYAYRYIILTEHLPSEVFEPNKDIISGQGIRLKKGSGVDLLIPPFNLKVKEAQILSKIPYPSGKGIIVTTLYEL